MQLLCGWGTNPSMMEVHNHKEIGKVSFQLMCDKWNYTTTHQGATIETIYFVCLR
jgi:hypothetical protein